MHGQDLVNGERVASHSLIQWYIRTRKGGFSFVDTRVYKDTVHVVVSTQCSPIKVYVHSYISHESLSVYTRLSDLYYDLNSEIAVFFVQLKHNVQWVTY